MGRNLKLKSVSSDWVKCSRQNTFLARVLAALLVLSAMGPLLWAAQPREFLNWSTKENLVSADIQSTSLGNLLDQVALTTGWRIYLEPGTSRTVSAKFRDLNPGDALRHLMGDLNFALVPTTNSPPVLYVFRTSRENATQLVNPVKPKATESVSKAIANELIVRLKPGAKIDDIARLLGAKVIGRIDSLNAYRLQFDDPAATEAAREKLASNAEVASVENNYEIARPESPMQVTGSSAIPPQLQLKPPPDSGRIIVGLIDTAVQSLGGNLDQFLLKSISIAGEASLDPASPSHGTGMAEVIIQSLAALTKGETSVQILPVDVYGPHQSTTTFDVAAGMVAAANGGARVLNLSFAGEGDSAFMRDLISQLNNRGILMFAAKGNTPVTIPLHPAADDGVNAVTSIDRGQVAPWANRAEIPAIGAPAGSVVFYHNQPFYIMGTSVSTAFASGMAAGFMDARGQTAAAALISVRTSLALPGGK